MPVQETDIQTREIRSMILAAFPCPPLPMEGSDRFLNSHDMLAFLIDVAARRDNAAENAKRQTHQQALTSQYLKDLQKCEDEESTWNTMTLFMRQYMMTYHCVMHETRFLPFDLITPPMRKQVCSWLASQHILQGDNQVTGSMFEHMKPWPLYERCRNMINYHEAICVSGAVDETSMHECAELHDSAGAGVRSEGPDCQSV